MYYLITNYGSRSKTKGIHASYMFVIYTLFGSLFLFVGLLTLYSQSGSFNYSVLSTLPIDSSYQIILWISFFICFAVKLPIIPFHIWLLTAHVEGSTAASVILAAIL
jgi:NADH:ubiquinone oxidoreductase subunit 4 (subunit M)